MHTLTSCIYVPICVPIGITPFRSTYKVYMGRSSNASVEALLIHTFILNPKRYLEFSRLVNGRWEEALKNAFRTTLIPKVLEF